MILHVIFAAILAVTLCAPVIFYFKTKAKRHGRKMRKEDLKDLISITGFAILFEVIAYITILILT